MTALERAQRRAHLDYGIALANSGRSPSAQAHFDRAFVEIVAHSLCDVGALSERICTAFDLS